MEKPKQVAMACIALGSIPIVLGCVLLSYVDPRISVAIALCGFLIATYGFYSFVRDERKRYPWVRTPLWATIVTNSVIVGLVIACITLIFTQE